MYCLIQQLEKTQQKSTKHVGEADMLGCTCFVSLHSACPSGFTLGCFVTRLPACLLAQLLMQDAGRMEVKAAGKLLVLPDP